MVDEVINIRLNDAAVEIDGAGEGHRGTKGQSVGSVLGQTARAAESAARTEVNREVAVHGERKSTGINRARSGNGAVRGVPGLRRGDHDIVGDGTSLVSSAVIGNAMTADSELQA